MSLSELRQYVQTLDNLIKSEFQFSDSIAKNTRILFNDTKAVAIRTNIVSTDFLKFRELSSCERFKLISKVERQKMFSKMEGLFNDIISSKLTPRILPIDLLRDIVKDARLIEDTLLELDPLAFYGQSTVSLISANETSHSIELLLATPKVNKNPTYVALNVLSTKASVYSNGKPMSLRLRRPSDLFLPIDMIKDAQQFPLKTLNDAKRIKRLNGCHMISGKKVCRNIIPIERDEQICLHSLITNTSSGGACHIDKTAVDQAPDITVDQGSTGVLISAPATYTIYGTKNGKKQRLVLTAPTAPGTKTCVFVPSRYDTIELTDGQTTEIIRQHIDVNIDYSDATVEGAFYPFESDIWNTDDSLEKNLTMDNIEEMVRKNVYGQLSMQGTSWTTIILGVVSFLFFLGLIVVTCLYLGILRPRPSGNMPPGAGRP